MGRELRRRSGVPAGCSGWRVAGGGSFIFIRNSELARCCPEPHGPVLHGRGHGQRALYAAASPGEDRVAGPESPPPCVCSLRGPRSSGRRPSLPPARRPGVATMQ